MNRSREGSTRGGERDDLSARGEELRNMFSRARAFTEELLRENERLRFRVAGLEREIDQPDGKTPSSPSESVKELTERLHTLEKERDDLLARFRQVEAMNRSVAARYEEIEAQNNHLANLYVASYQLHATLNFAEVLDTVREILINLIGAEGFAIFWVDERGGRLRRELSQGMGTSVPEKVRPEDRPPQGRLPGPVVLRRSPPGTGRRGHRAPDRLHSAENRHARHRAGGALPPS